MTPGHCTAGLKHTRDPVLSPPPTAVGPGAAGFPAGPGRGPPAPAPDPPDLLGELLVLLLLVVVPAPAEGLLARHRSGCCAAARPPHRRFPSTAAARGDDATTPRRSRATPPLCPHLGRATAVVPASGAGSAPCPPGRGWEPSVPSPTGHALPFLRRPRVSHEGRSISRNPGSTASAGGRCLSGTPWREGAVGSVGPTLGFIAQPLERDVTPSPGCSPLTRGTEPRCWVPGRTSRGSPRQHPPQGLSPDRSVTLAP